MKINTQAWILQTNLSWFIEFELLVPYFYAIKHDEDKHLDSIVYYIEYEDIISNNLISETK